MFKRIIATITAGASLGASAVAANNFTLGSSTFSVPAGWKETINTDERLTFSTPDNREQATVSVMKFNAVLSFENFSRICALRYNAEKEGLDDLSLQPVTPAPVGGDGKYSMTFSGVEEKNGRIFSGFLSYQGTELITIYVEGIGVAPEKHLDSFSLITSSLKRQ